MQECTSCALMSSPVPASSVCVLFFFFLFSFFLQKYRLTYTWMIESVYGVYYRIDNVRWYVCSWFTLTLHFLFSKCYSFPSSLILFFFSLVRSFFSFILHVLRFQSIWMRLLSYLFVVCVCMREVEEIAYRLCLTRRVITPRGLWENALQSAVCSWGWPELTRLYTARMWGDCRYSLNARIISVGSGSFYRRTGESYGTRKAATLDGVVFTRLVAQRGPRIGVWMRKNEGSGKVGGSESVQTATSQFLMSM